MVYNSVFYKDTSFKAEKERRLVFYPFGNVRNLRYKNVTGTYDKDQMYYDKMLELVKEGEKMGEFYTQKSSGLTGERTAKVWRGARCCWRWAM